MYMRLNIEAHPLPRLYSSRYGFRCKYSQLSDTTLNLKTSLHYPYHIATSQFAPTICLPDRIKCFGQIYADLCTVHLISNTLKKVL